MMHGQKNIKFTVYSNTGSLFLLTMTTNVCQFHISHQTSLVLLLATHLVHSSPIKHHLI